MKKFVFVKMLLAMLLPVVAVQAAVPVGSSSLIGTLDYSDTYDISSGFRNGVAYTPGSTPLPAAVAVIENSYGNPSVSWPLTTFSLVTDATVTVVPSQPYPGTSGAGSDTGFTQVASSTGETNWGIPYALRDVFVVQTDFIQMLNRIDIMVGTVAGDRSHANTLAVFIRYDGHGSSSGEISIYNNAVSGTKDSPTGLDSKAILGQWHNYAVLFDKTANSLTIFIDEVPLGTIDLATFQGGKYAGLLAGATTVSIGGQGATNERKWTDNFQIGSLAKNALSPLPQSGAQSVNPAGLSLSWQPPFFAGTYTYDVYLSTLGNPGNLVLVSSGQSELTYTPPTQLAFGALYNWRVVTRESGAVVGTGAIWSFTTGGGVANAYPADNTDNQGYESIQLRWNDDGIPASYDVYFSTDALNLGTPVNITDAQVLKDVNPNTEYFWRVDTKDGGGSVIITGDVMSFTTGDLWGYWKMDDGSGLVAADSSLYSNNAVVDPNSVWTTGVDRGAVNYPSPTDFDPTVASYADVVVNEVSVAGWVNMAYGTTYQYPFRITGGNGELYVVGNQGNWQIWLRRGTGTALVYVNVDMTVSANQWHHLCVTYDGSHAPSYRIYVDGVERDTYNGAYPLTLNSFEWGGRLNGRMDDVQLYNAVLSAQDVMDIYSDNALAMIVAPLDGATLVPVDVVCQWTPGNDITSQVFQIDDDPDMSADLLESVPLGAVANSYDPLNLSTNTDYYWRINSVQSGGFTVEGPVWTFKTIPPIAASPDPANSATGVAQNKVLGWVAGSGFNAASDEHRLYIAAGSTGGDLPGTPTATLTVETYDPDLAFNTQYVWRVDEYIGGVLFAGDVWTFTTGAPICDPVLAADINDDCIVDLLDFAEVAAAWLQCTLTNGDCP